MAGGVVMVLVMVLAVPVGVMLLGAAWSALAGLLVADAAEENAPPE
jgi:hypothetical protein